MKFNVVRLNNRDFVDIGDLNSSYYNISLNTSGPDRGTLATVVSGNNYIMAKFSEKQPKENTLYEVSVPDGVFYNEIIRVSKENKKNLKKNPVNEVTVIDQATYELQSSFTPTQLKQLQELISNQNIDIKKVFEEAVKKITITIEPPAEQAKPKASAKKS